MSLGPKWSNYKQGIHSKVEHIIEAVCAHMHIVTHQIKNPFCIYIYIYIYNLRLKVVTELIFMDHIIDIIQFFVKGTVHSEICSVAALW